MKKKSIRTAAQAVAWVRENVTRSELNRMGHRSPVAAVIWWWADKVAEDLAEMKHKELMDIVVYGYPKLTLPAVATEMEAFACPGADWRDDLEIFFKDKPESINDE